MHTETTVVYGVTHRVQDYWLPYWYSDDCRTQEEAQKKMDALIQAFPTKDFRLVKRTIRIEEEVLGSKINI